MVPGSAGGNQFRRQSSLKKKRGLWLQTTITKVTYLCDQDDWIVLSILGHLQLFKFAQLYIFANGGPNFAKY